MPGTSLALENKHGKVVVKQDEVIVARLSSQAHQQWLTKLELIESVTVLAMIRRYREDNDEAYVSRCQTGQWEVPMLELVLCEKHHP